MAQNVFKLFKLSIQTLPSLCMLSLSSMPAYRHFIWILTPSSHLQEVAGGVENHPLLLLSAYSIPHRFLRAHTNCSYPSYPSHCPPPMTLLTLYIYEFSVNTKNPFPSDLLLSNLFILANGTLPSPLIPFSLSFARCTKNTTARLPFLPLFCYPTFLFLQTVLESSSILIAN